MSESGLAAVRSQHRPGLRWSTVVPIAVVSIVTMPITAMWFLLLAPLVGVLGAAAAAFARSASAKDRDVSRAASISVGLLAGPIVYLALALVF
jgi:hypothetical protein